MPKQLTQEYFDKGIANILEKMSDMATKDDIRAIRSEMATKEDIAAIRSEMATKDYVHQAFEVQQTWMDERFKELIVEYDVRERVTKLEKDVAQLKLRRPAHA